MNERLAKHFLRRLRREAEALALESAVEAGILGARIRREPRPGAERLSPRAGSVGHNVGTARRQHAVASQTQAPRRKRPFHPRQFGSALSRRRNRRRTQVPVRRAMRRHA